MKFVLKRILSVSIAIAIVFCSAFAGLGEIAPNSFLGVEAEAAGIDALTFELNSNEKSYSVTDCKESVSGKLVIPDTYNGLKVTEIGQLAFYNCGSLTSVTIPDTVISIGRFAFFSCTSLKSITVPDSVTNIGGFAFKNCGKLKTVKIGKGVINIGEYAFQNCTKLEKVYWNAKNLGDLNSESKVFYNTGTEASEINVILGKSVERIPSYAFRGVKLTSIKIPDSVKSIGDHAFYCCTKLASIKIPDSVTSIGASAFSGCRSLASIEIPDSVTQISKFSFQNCTELNSIKLPDSINKIGDRAFYNTGYYNNIENWDGAVLYIGNNLICAEETVEGDYEIKSSTKTIADLAFANCENISSVVIPYSVDNIGYAAFKNCINLNSITLPDSVNKIEDIAFYNTGYYNNKNNWDKFALYIGNHLIRAKKSLEGAYKIKEGTVNIADWAFLNREKLTSIEIPDSVVSIGSEAFRMCENLDSVYISDVAAWCNIDFKDAIANPFYYADELYIDDRLATDVVIPAGVTSISESAFRGCTSITSIEIPHSVTKIGKYAFRDCTNLKSIIVSDSVENIGYLAFYNTEYYNDRTNWDESALYIGNHLIRARASLKGDYKVKDGTVTIVDKAFFNRKNINSVVASDGVSNIGDRAFMNCTNLNTITLPDSVKNIAYLAFYNTGYYNNKDNWDESVIYIGNHLIRAKTSLAGSYEVKRGTITIADKAFRNCDSLTFVKIHSSVKNIGKDIFYQCDKLIDSID